MSFLPEKYLYLGILQLKLKIFFYDEVLIQTLTYLEDWCCWTATLRFVVGHTHGKSRFKWGIKKHQDEITFELVLMKPIGCVLCLRAITLYEPVTKLLSNQSYVGSRFPYSFLLTWLIALCPSIALTSIDEFHSDEPFRTTCASVKQEIKQQNLSG